MPLHVVTSEIAVRTEGADRLESSFRDRIGLVDQWDGFDHLEVWRDLREPGRYVMTSWWESSDHFRAYMRSDDHRRSHARIPSGDDRPRPVRLDRYELVSR